MASRSTQAQSPLFLIGSVGIHLAILGGILLSPAREYIFEREKTLEPEIIARDDRLEELMEDVRDRTVERLQERVGLLVEGQDRMAKNFEIVNAHLQPFQEMQAATARDRFEQYAKAAVDFQKQLLDLLKTSPANPEEWNATEAEARQLTARLLSAQEEIRRGMMLLGHSDPELQERQASAEQGQFTVGQSLRELAEALSEEERKLAQLDRDQASLKNSIKQIADLTDQMLPVERALAEARAREESLLAEPEESKAGKKRAQDGQRSAARRTVIGTGRKLGALRNQLARAVAARDSRVGAIASVTKRLEVLALRKTELLAQSLERQRAATQLQRSVIEEIEKAAPSTTPGAMSKGEL